MRTITLYTPADGDLAADQIAKLLLDLPRGGEHNYYHFDRRGDRFTIAWRYEDGTWGVTFRDPPTESATARRPYGSPVQAARAIIAREHPPVNDPTVCEPAPEPVLTEAEQAMREHLVGVARRLDPAADVAALVAGLPGYQKVRDAIDPEEQTYKGPRCHGMGDGLRAISAYDWYHGRPTVTALVKRAGTKHPAAGWWDSPGDGERSWQELLESWHEAVRAAVAYWHADDEFGGR